jgi:hypothetical protein
MTKRNRIIVAVLWSLSLVLVGEWSARAQPRQLPGVEVRLLPSGGNPGRPHGTLVALIDGQWVPVTVDMTSPPDGNSLIRR